MLLGKLHIDVPTNLKQNLLDLSEYQQTQNHSGVGSWQGQLSLRNSKYVWVNEIVHIVQDTISTNIKKCQIQRVWCNINRMGNYNRWHKHELDGVSAVYYVSIPANSGDIEFRKEKELLRITPVAGDLLVFPGNLEHHVFANESDEPRISLAFNLC